MTNNNIQLWHYDNLHNYNAEYYKNIINEQDLEDDEITIKNKTTGEHDYFYTAKKDKTTYLIPVTYYKDGQTKKTIESMPIRPLATNKRSHRGKAMTEIITFNPIKITPTHTKTFKTLIDELLPITHESPKEYTLWKIITYTALSDRLNIRVMTYPNWLKDSILVIYKLLFNNTTTVNKPSLAKLKYLLNNHNKIIGLNEVQNISPEDKEALSRFYEDVGDFKPHYENPKRGSTSVTENCDISQLSTITFYNLPETTEDQDKIFDKTFQPKIRSRIYPLLFTGGSHTRGASQHKFGRITEPITQEQIAYLTEWMKNILYYNLTYPKGTNQYKRTHAYDNNRWQRNYDAILSRIDMYSQNQEEFTTIEETLYQANTRYQEYIQNQEFNKPTIITEDVK